jgi:hypothetical protein
VWIGQDNQDLVQVGGAPGGNGIQDIHLRADALAPHPLKQVVVICRFPKQLRVWRLDTSQSPHWRLAVARSELAGQADMYLEPPANDCYGMNFDVTFTYADGSTFKTSVSATTHTSDTLKVDRGTQPGKVAAPASNAPARGQVSEIHLADGNRLSGEVLAIDAEKLTLRASWDAQVEIPVLHVKGVWFGGSAAPAGARADFDKQLATPTADDAVFLSAPDQTAAQVAGAVKQLKDDKLELRYDGQDRAINKDRLLGLVFAAHPKLPAPERTYQAFLLASGETIAGDWLGLDDAGLEVQTAWQARWRIPAASVAEVRVRNGKVVYLPDLEPAAVEEVAYFNRLVPWGRDCGFDGNPAAMKGKRPGRSLAMHSRSVLTYALDEQFATFKATVGFDDSSANRGRVSCRVSVDGRELFVEDDLRADRDPMPVEVAVAGGKQLTLEVDFGKDDDVGDRVLWAEPRLFRSRPK